MEQTEDIGNINIINVLFDEDIDDLAFEPKAIDSDIDYESDIKYEYTKQ